MIPYLKFYTIADVVSVDDFEIPMSREDFNMYRSMSGIGGKSHTDEDYHNYNIYIKEKNIEIGKEIGKERLKVNKIAVGKNTDLTIIEKEKGFVKWIT